MSSDSDSDFVPNPEEEGDSEDSDFTDDGSDASCHSCADDDGEFDEDEWVVDRQTKQKSASQNRLVIREFLSQGFETLRAKGFPSWASGLMASEVRQRPLSTFQRIRTDPTILSALGIERVYLSREKDATVQMEAGKVYYLSLPMWPEGRHANAVVVSEDGKSAVVYEPHGAVYGHVTEALARSGIPNVTAGWEAPGPQVKSKEVGRVAIMDGDVSGDCAMWALIACRAALDAQVEETSLKALCSVEAEALPGFKVTALWSILIQLNLRSHIEQIRKSFIRWGSGGSAARYQPYEKELPNGLEMLFFPGKGKGKLLLSPGKNLRQVMVYVARWEGERIVCKHETLTVPYYADSPRDVLLGDLINAVKLKDDEDAWFGDKRLRSNRNEATKLHINDKQWTHVISTVIHVFSYNDLMSAYTRTRLCFDKYLGSVDANKKTREFVVAAPAVEGDHVKYQDLLLCKIAPVQLSHGDKVTLDTPIHLPDSLWGSEKYKTMRDVLRRKELPVVLRPKREVHRQKIKEGVKGLPKALRNMAGYQLRKVHETLQRLKFVKVLNKPGLETCLLLIQRYGDIEFMKNLRVLEKIGGVDGLIARFKTHRRNSLMRRRQFLMDHVIRCVDVKALNKLRDKGAVHLLRLLSEEDLEKVLVAIE